MAEKNFRQKNYQSKTGSQQKEKDPAKQFTSKQEGASRASSISRSETNQRTPVPSTDVVSTPFPFSPSLQGPKFSPDPTFNVSVKDRAKKLNAATGSSSRPQTTKQTSNRSIHAAVAASVVQPILNNNPVQSIAETIRDKSEEVIPIGKVSDIIHQYSIRNQALSSLETSNISVSNLAETLPVAKLVQPFLPSSVQAENVNSPTLLDTREEEEQEKEIVPIIPPTAQPNHQQRAIPARHVHERTLRPSQSLQRLRLQNTWSTSAISKQLSSSEIMDVVKGFGQLLSLLAGKHPESPISFEGIFQTMLNSLEKWCGNETIDSFGFHCLIMIMTKPGIKLNTVQLRRVTKLGLSALTSVSAKSNPHLKELFSVRLPWSTNQALRTFIVQNINKQLDDQFPSILREFNLDVKSHSQLDDFLNGFSDASSHYLERTHRDLMIRWKHFHVDSVKLFQNATTDEEYLSNFPGKNCSLAHPKFVQPHVPMRTLVDRYSSPHDGPAILSIDGGGVRGGIIVLNYLIELEHILSTRNPGTKLLDYFDFVAGTSVGGIIALKLMYPKTETENCLDVYEFLLKLAPEVFGSKRLGDVLMGRSEEMFQSSVLEKNLQEHFKFLPIDHRRYPFCFVTTQKNQQEHFFCNYDSGAPNQSSRVPVWTAARATSAAPIYFKGLDLWGDKYVDGGVGMNNPALEACLQARQAFQKELPGCLVSFGCGTFTGELEAVEQSLLTNVLAKVRSNLTPAFFKKLGELFGFLRDKATNSHRVDSELSQIFEQKDCYHRFNLEHQLPVELSDSDKDTINYLESLIQAKLVEEYPRLLKVADRLDEIFHRRRGRD